MCILKSCQRSSKLPARVVFRYEPLPQYSEVSLFEIEVGSRDHLFPAIRNDPIDNLRRVHAQKCAVVFIERLAVFARDDPHVIELPVLDVFQVFFETRKRR